MGAFAQIAQRLIERGYVAVPIIPGTKRPGVLLNGQWVGLPRWQTRFKKRAPSATELARWSVIYRRKWVRPRCPRGEYVARVRRWI
jgi:hypothetical protein